MPHEAYSSITARQNSAYKDRLSIRTFRDYANKRAMGDTKVYAEQALYKGATHGLIQWEYLSLHRENRVLEVTFRSPNKVNSLNNALMRELTQLAQELQFDSELNAIILTGAAGYF